MGDLWPEGRTAAAARELAAEEQLRVLRERLAAVSERAAEWRTRTTDLVERVRARYAEDDS